MRRNRGISVGFPWRSYLVTFCIFVSNRTTKVTIFYENTKPPTSRYRPFRSSLHGRHRDVRLPFFLQQPFPRTPRTAPDGAGKRPQAPAHPTHRLLLCIVPHGKPVIRRLRSANLRQVSTKSASGAIKLDTSPGKCRFRAEFRGRCTKISRRMAFFRTPVGRRSS